MIAVVVAALSWSNAGWADNPKPTPVRASWVDDPFERKPLPIALRPEPVKPEPVTPSPKPSVPPPKAPVAPADEWRVFTANPAYEVYGHIESGVFRYTQSRARATTFHASPRYYAPVLQYGSPCANGSCPR